MAYGRIWENYCMVSAYDYQFCTRISDPSTEEIWALKYTTMSQYFIYIIECSDKTLYTGYTNDLKKRLETHNKWKWAKYTRGRIPVTLYYSESFDTESEARKREYAIKKLSRKDKLQLKNIPS